MTFTNTLQPVELVSALGIGLILLMALGYLLVHAARLARDLGLGAVRAAFAVLLLGGALLLGYVGWRVTQRGPLGGVTLRVEPAGLLHRSSGAPDVLVSWSEIDALVRTHASGRDTWVLEAGSRQLAWDDSIRDASRLQDLVLQRAELLHREREGQGEESWTARWTRPPSEPMP